MGKTDRISRSTFKIRMPRKYKITDFTAPAQTSLSVLLSWSTSTMFKFGASARTWCNKNNLKINVFCFRKKLFYIHFFKSQANLVKLKTGGRPRKKCKIKGPCIITTTNTTTTTTSTSTSIEPFACHFPCSWNPYKGENCLTLFLQSKEKIHYCILLYCILIVYSCCIILHFLPALGDSCSFEVVSS